VLWFAALDLLQLFLSWMESVLVAALETFVESHEDTVAMLLGLYSFWRMGFMGLYPSVFSL
jgi:hypothetical protein